MHAVSGYKHREIADLLDMPQGTVLSKYKRALEKLKQALDPEDHSNEKTMELTDKMERKEGVDEQR